MALIFKPLSDLSALIKLFQTLELLLVFIIVTKPVFIFLLDIITTGGNFLEGDFVLKAITTQNKQKALNELCGIDETSINRI